jgi:phosphodiesterase/alkaline phosphatase D-like protein
MHTHFLRSHTLRRVVLSLGAASLLAIASTAEASFSFTGVAAGDATNTSITLWTRAVDDAAPATATVTMEVATDPGFAHIIATSVASTTASTDYTVKFSGSGLRPSKVYYYRFRSGASRSLVGRFKTAPAPREEAPVHFAFSGDNDGLMRPYALASALPDQKLDFYINLGDVIYETASNVLGNIGGSYLNSPSVTLSNEALNFNGVPRAFIPSGTPFATRAQLFEDYSKKYRENFLPVNAGGQKSLQALYAAQGNYTTWDNHELGNRKYIDGGAPAGGSVGGAAGIDMPTGRGVDARNNGAGNPLNVNDVNPSPSDFMNRSAGFLTLQQVFLNYQPIADLGVVNAISDPRTHGTKRLFSAHQWGRNAIYINTDARSYRDIRLKTSNGGADDTTAPRANNAGRTYLGATQLAWLQQTLLDAQHAGTPWKFVSVSDPVDQIGAIGSGADGGKSYMGGYRAERNALLKFIADHHITNVVFMSTDDHQNRINELTYSPSGQTEAQSSYEKVPYCFSIVAGPLGATGPDAITDHSFANIKLLADTLATTQAAAGVEPIGLQGYPGLHDLFREGDPMAGVAPQAVDFYSPDTFNFTVLDVSESGRTLTVKSVGINSTAQNAAVEYSSAAPARTVFSFKIRAARARRDDDEERGGDREDDNDRDH